MTAAQAGSFIAEMATIELFRPGQWAQLAIADAQTGQLVGDLGVYLGESGEFGEIGFTLSTESRGKGYATAAAREAVSLFFEQTSVHRVRGVTDARNTASVAILERLGFKRTEVREVVFKGEPCTEWVYTVYR